MDNVTDCFFLSQTRSFISTRTERLYSSVYNDSANWSIEKALLILFNRSIGSRKWYELIFDKNLHKIRSQTQNFHSPFAAAASFFRLYPSPLPFLYDVFEIVCWVSLILFTPRTEYTFWNYLQCVEKSGD